MTPSMNMKLVYRTAWLQFREISCSYTENLDSIAADARLVPVRRTALRGSSMVAGKYRRLLGNLPSTDFTAKSRRSCLALIKASHGSRVFVLLSRIRWGTLGTRITRLYSVFTD